MDFFQFVISLGVIQVIFGFILHWIIMFPCSLIMVTLKIEHIGNFIVELFEAYLLISLTAIITIIALEDISGGWKFYIYPLLGSFVLYSRFVSAIYEEQKMPDNPYNYYLLSYTYLKYKKVHNLVLIFGSPILYLIALFINPIAENTFILWLFNIVQWINNLPVIGFLIGIGGVIFMLKTFLHGFMILNYLADSKIETKSN